MSEYDDIPPFEDGTALFHCVGYEDPDIEKGDGEYRVANHDEAEKFYEIRRLEAETLLDNGWTAVTPDDTLYREAFTDLEVGEAVEL
jgi:hypothetical protein